ncbi:MAG: hypothetical protein R3F41_02440 [Gammaproteobacteria bacterium]|nr:hypothetical protein [Pseudomonadales bacterium]
MRELLAILAGTALAIHLILALLPAPPPTRWGSGRFAAATVIALGCMPVLAGTTVIHSALGTVWPGQSSLAWFSLGSLTLLALVLTVLTLRIMEHLFPLSVRRRYLTTLLIATAAIAPGLGVLVSPLDPTWSGLFAIAAGCLLGLPLLLLSLAALSERLELLDVPRPFRGAPINVLTALLSAAVLLGLIGVY